MTRVVFTVECIKDCHFRVDADSADARGRIERVYDPVCPYCGTRLFKRWWKHEMPDPEPVKEEEPDGRAKGRVGRRPLAKRAG